MSISINNNNGIIEVSQTGSVPKSYFKMSGKLYPSGSVSGQARSTTGVFAIISNDTSGCTDDFYNYQQQGSTSGNGSGATFNIYINGGTIQFVASAQPNLTEGTGLGYAVGDTMTIYGSDYGGTGSCVVIIEALGIDGFLINFDNDVCDVRFYDLVIGGSSPTSLSEASSLLINLIAPNP